ncbi:SDR family oxidoreductase [Altericroceibacterium endophyticum]|uniref:SDR family oxidoreductase n=1 Tax=Altericroceibacterium endophyticum TaxID=1808508 RepID=A0A6I4T4C4_9SPHN|nr:SDR family oxidoreductase [Altericroceibacterium endophyticum]MXO64913.1 SDR family oxidoreductase [Altericroceibacterium endophyticum]
MARPAILITGAAKRIGAAIARHFGENGWHVIVHYNHSHEAAETLSRSLPSAETIRCDLSHSGAGVAMVEELADKLTDWRVLINSASIFPPDAVSEMEPEIFGDVMQVNAKAPVRMAQTFLRLAKAGGDGGRRVIQITDQKIANPNPDFFSYTMSKHALSATIPMMAMAASEADRIYGIAPGAILPSHDQSDEEAEISHRMNLLHRRTSAQEIAEAALFLSHGRLASGQTIFVDSGQHLVPQPRDVLYLAREQAS